MLWLWNENTQLQFAAILGQMGAAPDGYFWTEIGKQSIVALLLLGANLYQYKEGLRRESKLEAKVSSLEQELKDERKEAKDRRDGKEKATEAMLIAVGNTNELVAQALNETKEVLNRMPRR